jgi:hypothetical protein
VEGELGLDRFVVRNQVDAGRWVELTPMVLATFTGPLRPGATAAAQWSGPDRRSVHDPRAPRRP